MNLMPAIMSLKTTPNRSPYIEADRRNIHTETLIQAIHRKGLKNLTAVSNNAGSGSNGLALLTQNGRLDRIILSYLGSNKSLERQYLTGQIAVELCPQGTLAERLRAAGAGIPAFYTATGGSKLFLSLSTPSFSYAHFKMNATDDELANYRDIHRNR